MWIQAIHNFIASGVMRHMALKITPLLEPKEMASQHILSFLHPNYKVNKTQESISDILFHLEG